MTTKKKKPIKKVKRKTTKSKSAKKRYLSQNMRILLATAFLLAFVVICLVALVNLRTSLLPESVSVQSDEYLVYEEPADEIHKQKIFDYTDIRELIENQLINGPHSMGWRRLPDQKNIQVRKIFGDFPSAPFLAELVTHIEHTDSPAQLKVSRKNGIIHLFWQDDLRLELRYQIPTTVKTQQGKIAVIMDDMGVSLSTLHKLLQLDIIITPSILPSTGKALSSASLLQEKGREYMIHLPMQPRSYPRTSPGANALLLGQSEAETRQLVQSYMAAVPGAVGGNNHMGSRYTEESEGMRIVLNELKEHDLFFIDSRTIGSSVAFSEARKMGLKTATRNIFLDNQDDIPYIRRQIRKMVNLAGKNKEVIAICHPHAATLEAFRLEQGWLKQQSVDFVSASKLVHTY
ncbi:MAG: divergent polysaccharide deacetylase family protein [Desulfuromusa sp.]|nr:divergent polysaccharide deacetylase family protein [Desulfuromusa sp.]